MYKDIFWHVFSHYTINHEAQIEKWRCSVLDTPLHTQGERYWILAWWLHLIFSHLTPPPLGDCTGGQVEGHLSANNCGLTQTDCSRSQTVWQRLANNCCPIYKYRVAQPICSVSIIQTIGDSTQLVPLLYKSKAVDHDVILRLHFCPVTTISSLWRNFCFRSVWFWLNSTHRNSNYLHSYSKRFAIFVHSSQTDCM